MSKFVIKYEVLNNNKTYRKISKNINIVIYIVIIILFLIIIILCPCIMLL